VKEEVHPLRLQRLAWRESALGSGDDGDDEGENVAGNKFM
jgi:hypothetical protein